MKLSKIYTLAGSVFVMAAAQATPLNSGFESGDFSNWTVSIPSGVSGFPPFDRPAGTAEVVSSWIGGTMPTARFADEGSHFLALGTLERGYFTGGAAYDISASQTFTLHQDDTVTGAVFFFNGDYEVQDSAWVKILDASGNNLIATPWLKSSGNPNPNDPSATPYQDASPWTSWQWTAPATGEYTLSLGVSTFGDNRFATYGFFDGIGVMATTVPEPSSAALLVGFLSGFLAIRRKRRA